LKLVPHEKKIFDDKAQTVAELAPIWSVQIARMGTIANGYVASGEWERVWRKDRLGRPIPAYRTKK
jgi:hypothetical protein